MTMLETSPETVAPPKQCTPPRDRSPRESLFHSVDRLATSESKTQDLDIPDGACYHSPTKKLLSNIPFAVPMLQPQFFYHPYFLMTSQLMTSPPIKEEEDDACEERRLMKDCEELMPSFCKNRKGHVCIYCGKLYSRKYGLKIHLRTHTGYKPLKCKVCQRPFGDPSNLNKHIRLHAQGETPYRCDHCGKVLVRRRDLDRHIKSRHPQIREESTGTCVSEDEVGLDDIDVENV